MSDNARYNLERAFNIREGFSRKDDRLPERFIKESPEHGLASEVTYEMDQMLDDYYGQWDWDIKTGYPKRQGLKNLDLEYVARDLEKMGKLR